MNNELICWPVKLNSGLIRCKRVGKEVVVGLIKSLFCSPTRKPFLVGIVFGDALYFIYLLSKKAYLQRSIEALFAALVIDELEHPSVRHCPHHRHHCWSHFVVQEI